MRPALRLMMLSFLAATLFGCVPPKGGKGGHGGAAPVDPKACGNISTSNVGKKLASFLEASAELDRTSREMEKSVLGACKKMAKELGVSTRGDIKTVCTAAAKALDENLKISVRSESRMVTRYTPPECTTELDFAAEVAAECDAKVAADINVSCEGSCGGTCSGTCDGTCRGDSDGGQCNGVCEGTCRGSCSADCHGYADIDASVECEASAEVRASLRTECSEPKVEVVREDVTIVDDAKFQRAMAAIDAGLPTILKVGAKAVLVGKALVNWGKTLGSLVAAGGELAEQLGDKGLCVIGQLVASFAAVVDVEARVEISIEVSASVSASAGASGK